VRRFLGFLLLAGFAASLNFAQVAPVTHSKSKAQSQRPQQLVSTTTTKNGDRTSDDDDDADTSDSPAMVAQAKPNPNAPAGRPAPSVPRVVPPPAQAQNPPAANTPAGSQQTVRLQFPNSDVKDVLRFYESLTGKQLIMDNFVTGKVDIFLSKDVPRDEAIKIIEISLLMNGYSLIPSEGNIVKVIGTGKNPRTTGVPIVSDENEIPEGDHVISYLFKLRYADPQELLQALGQYLSPPQPYTSFLALPKAGAILVTENSSVIRTLAKIIDQVDVPPAEVVSEFIKLDRADATKVVDMLKDVFEKTESKTGQPGAGGYRGVRPVGAQNVPPTAPGEMPELAGLTALTEESVIVGKIKLEADERTNRIHVITRPVNMPFVRKLIAEFDANVEFAKPVTRPLRYIAAADVLPVIVQALSEPGQTGGAGAEQPAQPGASPGAAKRTTTSTTAAGGGIASTTSTTSSGYGGGSSGSSLNVSEELQTQPVDTTPKAVVIGNAKIIADQRANTIITLGNQEVVVKVGKILDEMDVKAPQVALSTVIGELTLSNDEELGVDWFAKYDKHVVGISRNTTVTIPNPTSGATGSTGSTGPVIGTAVNPADLVNFQNALTSVASGTNIFIAAGNYLATIVHALESTGKFKVISRPMVFTSNNKKAIIASGQEVPIPVNTLSNVGNPAVPNNGGVAAVASNIEYKKVALQLEVVPLINSEKEVSLDILQKIDSLVAGGSVSIGGNTVPTIATRYIRTNVSAKSGSTIVLGGLIQDNKQKSFSGIPVLDKIPYLGAAFRNTTYTRMRNELIIMCPEVTLTPLDEMRFREKAEDHTHFGPEIDQGYCPDCPPRVMEEKQLDKQLPPPDLPFGNATRTH
jgi:type II secretion system protein D